MSSECKKSLLVTVRAVSTDVPLVRADDVNAQQQYLLNEAVLGSLLHAVKVGELLQLSVIEVPGQPSKILEVRRP
jgi:hypothetical protein